MKCLVVDDDRTSSLIAERLVSRHATCDVVVNGQEALNLFLRAHESKSPYDLILMDIMMPETNGLQAVLSIREKEAFMNIPLSQRVKVIMTSSLDNPLTVIKALYESDANSYLTKPISGQMLANELKKLKLIN